MEFIISLVTMAITWITGTITKKCPKIKNKIIPLENTLIMLISCLIYYYATGDFSMLIASSSPVATLIYDVIHNLRKE